MKKLFLLLIVLLSVIRVQGQLLNPGFELQDKDGLAANWRPASYVILHADSTCIWRGLDSIGFITTDAHSGRYAYEMRVADYCHTDVIGGNITSARFQTDTFADQRMLFTDRPAAFGFYYRMLPLSGDEGMMTVQLDDNAGRKVATGTIKLKTPTSGWTLATVPLTYYSGNNAAFLTMKFALHNDTVLHYGSRFLVDDISAITATGMTAIHEVAAGLSCFPVPAQDLLFVNISKAVTADQGSIVITDATGRNVYEERVLLNGKTLQLPVGQLAHGMYQLRLMTISSSAAGYFVK